MVSQNKSWVLLVFLLGGAMACKDATTRAPGCPEGQLATQSGCVPIRGDMGTEVNPPGVRLPLVVDDWYSPSGYMGDGEDPEARYLSGRESCDARAHDNAMGRCHTFEYRRGPMGQAGVFWQYPANNWGDSGQPGLTIPSGAQSVRFFAWSDTEGLSVNFVAGLGADTDGFNREISGATLSTTPQEFTIDVRDTMYTDVIGAFGWFMAANAETVTLFIDDLHWSTEPPLETYIEPEVSLPLSVQSYYTPSGYMGDGTDPDGRYLLPFEACPAESGGFLNLCTKFTLKPGGPEGAGGVYWQYPPNNWGDGGPDCMPPEQVCDVEGFTIPVGAKSIQFIAWSNQESYVVDFLAGIESVDGFSVTQTYELSQTPQLFSLDLTEIDYDKVVGGFGWYGAALESDVELYVQEVTYTTADPLPYSPPGGGGDVTQPMAPFELPYPLLAAFIPSGIMPSAASSMISIDACPETVPTALANCTQFTAVPGGSPWAGVYYHTTDDGWMGPAAEIPPGSTALTFYAWSDTAGVRRKFGVGDSAAGDPFGVELLGIAGANGQNEFELSTEPTQYRIEFPSSPERLVGGLFWAGPVGSDSVMYIAEAMFVEE